MVRLLEAVGVVGSVFFLTMGRGVRLSADAPTTFGFYLFLLTIYLFIRICDAIPWYPKQETPSGYSNRQVGIRVHFQKAIVPTSYVLFITSTVCLTTGGASATESWWTPLQFATVILADLCLLLVASVNGILIWFHLRDKEQMPVNYFSLNKYL